jgi:hypothetical protein
MAVKIFLAGMNSFAVNSGNRIAKKNRKSLAALIPVPTGGPPLRLFGSIVSGYHLCPAETTQAEHASQITVVKN